MCLDYCGCPPKCQNRLRRPCLVEEKVVCIAGQDINKGAWLGNYQGNVCRVSEWEESNDGISIPYLRFSKGNHLCFSPNQVINQSNMIIDSFIFALESCLMRKVQITSTEHDNVEFRYVHTPRKWTIQAFSSRRIKLGEKLTVNRHKLLRMPYAINKIKPNSYVVVKQSTLTEEELEKAKEFPWIAKVLKVKGKGKGSELHISISWMYHPHELKEELHKKCNVLKTEKKAKRSLKEVDFVKFSPKELILGCDHIQEISTDTVDRMVDVINNKSNSSEQENQNKWWCMKVYSFSKLSFISQ